VTRALLAVGGLLVVCLLAFGVAVYVTREEEHVAVDSDLAERLGLAVTEASSTGAPVDLAQVASFPWDRVVIVRRGTAREEISERLGFEFEGELSYDVESGALLVFAHGSALARFADYRGLQPFEGLPAELPRDEALLDVDSERVRPVSG
jgi:hypothetical protein